MINAKPKNLGPYRINRLLGQGGMGSVYEASDPRLNRKVAIKMVRQDLFSNDDAGYRSRFLREARATAMLNHRNIISIFDVGEDNGILYIVMEFINGSDLRERLHKTPPLTLRFVVDMAIEICSGLHHAHERGLVHRDMKPSNILLYENLIKITDFGIALKRGSTITGAGTLLGTPQYMSPEQYDTPKVDCRSDIFSLGVILYETLTGIRPFDADTPATIMKRIISLNPTPPSDHNLDIPKSISDAIMIAIEKKPANRYQSALEFMNHLQNQLQHLSNESLNETKIPTSKLPVTRLSSKPNFTLGNESPWTPDKFISPLPESTQSESDNLTNIVLLIVIVALVAITSISFAIYMY